MAENKYPEDEFDILARDRVSHGTHRKVEAASRWWIKALIVCVIAVALGLGLSFAYARFIAPKADVSTSQPAADEQASEDSGEATDAEAGTEEEGTGEEASTDPSADASTQAQPSEAATDDASAQATTEPAAPAQTQQPAPAAVKSTAVRVLNASKATGLAAKKKKVLTSAGYTSVQVGNAGRQSTRNTTVYYANPDLKATAEDIASTLGIAASNVVENANAAGSGVTVVLLGDI